MKKYYWLILLLSLVISINPILGHTPLQPNNNESLETAMEISDPTKSWAIYTELHDEKEAQYYIMHLEEGERLKVSLYVPLSEKDFKPSLVVMGSGISSNDILPEYIEFPQDVGIIILESSTPKNPEYEPFTPSSYYYLADFDLEITEHGDYFLVVYEVNKGGRYGLAVGYREVFGIDEWLQVPIDVLGIRQWEGQSILFVLSPLLASVVTGLLVIFWFNKELLSILRVWIMSIAGLLYLGSGFMIMMQMFIAFSVVQIDLSLLVTLVFALLPVFFGLLIIRTGIKETFNSRSRILIVLYGLLGFISWSGVLIGPILAVLSSFLPEKILRKER